MQSVSKLDEKRDYRVVKANDLIQRARYNLTVNQQKLIAYVISLIKPTDKELMMYEISVADFCELCGIDKTYFYTEFIEMMQELDKKSFLVETDDKIFNFRWFSEFEYLKGQGKVRVLLNSNLKKYLIDLHEHYTQYELWNLLALKGKYSLRFYELFQSYFVSKLSKHTEKEVDINELKKVLMAENYKTFEPFKRRVLEPAIKEINEYTDLNVIFNAIKSGKTVVAIKFNINRKTYPSNYVSYQKTIDRINKKNKQTQGQLSLFDLDEKNFHRQDYKAMTIKEIAASLGVSKQTVTRTIKKLNIETKWVGNRAVIDSQDDIERITAAVQSLQSIQKNDSNAPKYESNVAKNAKSAPENEPNETNQQLINMLQKELENKEKMIQRQQDTIDNLIRTNTALTAKVTMLEDKSSQQQQNTIVVPEPETKETKQEGRKHWWQRLFN